MELQSHGTVHSGIDLLDFGVEGARFVQTDQGLFVVTTSGRAGGLASYRMTSNGQWHYHDQAAFSGAVTHSQLDTLGMIQGDDGPILVVSGDDSGLWCFTLGADGRFGPQDRLSASAATSLTRMSDVDARATTLAYQAGVADMAMPPALEPDYGQLMVTAQVGDASFAIIADHEAAELAVLMRDPEGGAPHLAAQMGANEGLGIATPTALATAQINGATFVLLGAAGSSSISVMQLSDDGNLVLKDHLIDTLETRFGAIQSLKVITHDDHVLVLAGGGDDGITLFSLMPDGRLVWRATVADALDTGLTNIADIDAHMIGTTLHVAVGTQADAGVSVFTLDLSDLGELATSGGDSQSLAGTSGDDVLIAGTPNDTLRGEAGDDVLVAGAGSSILQGGAGADTFVLSAHSTNARITDFQLGIDSIDLSDWPMLRDPGALQIIETSTGARVLYRGMVLSVQSDDRQTLSADALFGTRFAWADRVMVSVEQARHDATPGLVLRAIAAGSNLDGSAWQDRLYGNTGRDTLSGAQGDDLIVGGGGHDALDGGAGDDTLYGNAGNDVLRGREGANFLSGGNDNDKVYGGTQDDTLQGGPGNDLIVGGAGDDSLRGDSGSDTLYGNAGTDLLRATSGASFLSGGDGNDKVYGGASDDTLQGGPGDDLIVGGSGDDSLRADSGNDTLFGNGGADLLRASTDAGFLSGGSGNDSLMGSADNDTLQGGPGNDLIVGGAGDDSLRADSGQDTLYGNGGDDLLRGTSGNNFLSGGAGNDKVIGALHDDTLQGGPGDDLIVGGDGNDSLRADSGDDTLYGNDGDDLLRASSGNNLLSGGVGNDRLIGAANRDTLLGGEGDDVLVGGDDRDRLQGDSGDDHLFGNNGVDNLLGGDGRDTLSGGTDTDYLTGGAGRDQLQGGAGADVFIWREASDSLHNSNRDTVLDFQSGEDHIDLSALADNLHLGTSFTGEAGQVVYVASQGRLYIDLDGNGSAEMSINFQDAPSLTADDFVL